MTIDDSWASAAADDRATPAGPRWTPPPGGALRSSPTRRLILFVIAALPWIVVAAMLMRPVAAPPPAPTTPLPTTAAQAGEDPELAQTVLPEFPDDAGTATIAGTNATTLGNLGTDATLAATALDVAHRTLGGHAGDVPSGLVAGTADRYVDHSAVERIVHRTAGAAIVIVTATVLVARDDVWSTISHVRLAVPLTFIGSVPVSAGPPWPLLRPPLDVSIPAATLLDDEQLTAAAATAITAAGYRDVDVSALFSTDVWPLVAEVTATAPGEAASRTQSIWLERRGADWQVVGADGSSAAAPTTATPPPVPTDESPAPSTTPPSERPSS